MEKDLKYYLSLPYRVEILPDETEGGYALSCPELPGCLTCALTVEEGLSLLADAKESWIAACLEDGVPVPEPARLEDYSGQFKLRLPKRHPQENEVRRPCTYPKMCTAGSH